MGLFGGRSKSRAKTSVVWTWQADDVTRKANHHMKKNAKKAVRHMVSKVVQNISIPIGPGAPPTRSRPGEFPRQETQKLKKSIKGVVNNPRKGTIDAIVYTPVEYGLILETSMNRSFLARTMREENRAISNIMTTPIR